MTGLNPTHNPARQSWVASANQAGTDFPIQNLPYGVFSTRNHKAHIGVAIGAEILDLTLLETEGVLTPAGTARVFAGGVLNPFMALPAAVWSATRAAISALLDAGTATLRDDPDLRDRALIPQADAVMHLPIFVRSFTDFYASRDHATNVGAMFRDPDHALPENWLHMPIAYNGRASTVVVSGTPLHRPLGQLKTPGAPPRLGPTRKLDFELEMGAIVGTPSQMGQPVTTAQATAMIFGYVLLNDWSARDIQLWEYQPLGPFLSKAFATSVSAWVVTAEALLPCRCAPPERELPLLPYLDETTPGGHDIALEVALTPRGGAPVTISRSNARHLYYPPGQQLAHHTASGCAMCTGDLLGSGTISGPERGSCGSMLELTRNGRDPLAVGDGSRRFLHDGDSVTIRGYGRGARPIGFGICEGTILAACETPGR